MFPIALGLVGFAINCLPIEIYPSVHLVFGGVMAILAALKFGPFAGGIAGLTAGLRTWSLWNQPFPLSAILYGLEGIWVGTYQKRSGKRGPLAAILAYWLLLGAWLGLAGHIFLFDVPFRLALIMQGRSIINGVLVGILVELIILVAEVIRGRLRYRREPLRLSLHSLIALVLLTAIALPMLYTSTRNVTDMRERMVNDLASSRSRDVQAIRGETESVLQNYRRGVATAAALFESPDHQPRNQEELSRLLASVRHLFPEFTGLYVADAAGKTIAFDPPEVESEHSGQTLIGLENGDRAYYRELVSRRATVYSGVCQIRRGVTGPALAIGEPLMDANHNFIGFVLGWFDLRSFQDIASRYSTREENQLISDREGLLIADSQMDPEKYNEVPSLMELADFELAFASTGKVNSGTVHVSHSEGSNGISAAQSSLNGFLLSRTVLPNTGWVIWSRQTLEPIKARLDKFYIDQLIVLMLALLLALILSQAVARLLAQPTLELSRSAASLASGNLSERPPRRSLITSEYASLFHSFDLMSERLESSWNTQQELLREVSVTKGELEATFDAMTDAVVMTDVEDHVLRANRAYCQLRGVEPENAIGRVLSDIAHPDEDWRVCEVCRARREGRNAVVLRKPNDTPINRYLEIRVDPIYNTTGERIGAVQVLRDLTEKHRVEAEAERAGSLLKNLVDAAYDAVYATDLDGRFLWANKRAAELLGFANNSLEGQSSLQSIHPDDLECVRSNLELASIGEAKRYEMRYLAADGSERSALMTNSPIYAEGEIAGILAVMRDITEERMVTEQTMRSDKLRALGQLASGVAHNFNNSLTAVLGYTQMVQTEITDVRLTKYLDTVEKAALDAAKMVQRIQNFARQRQDEPSTAADINQIIKDALDLTRSRWRDDARAAGVEYDIIFRPAENAVVTCDQSAVREVFVNIIINALDAMPDGGRLTITATLEVEGIAVSFSDSGCGMSEDIRQRIFEPFYTTKGLKGYGMGLAVSFGIIERHGGEIKVKSDPGRGSTFVLKLPLKRPSLEEEIPESSPGARSASVLVVDDELPIRMLLADLLRARGHKVLMAEDGLAGLRAIEGSRFDLVITDLSMPGADGWTLVNEVWRRWPGTKLVMVTGYGGFADVAVSGGDTSLVDALISKPFNIGEIDAKLNELLLRDVAVRLR